MTTKRVLLIDDEDDIREVVQLSLEIVAQWKVVSASSGPEGITVIGQPFDPMRLPSDISNALGWAA